MTQQNQFFPLAGGLDLITPAISARPGTVISCLNYEPAANGYKRLAGFERLDGHPSPSAATYWMLEFASGSAPIIAGQTVTGATSGATGKVLADGVVTSGSYGGSNAAGYLGLGVVTGTFVDGENLQVSGVTKAVADGTAEEGQSPDDTTAATWQATAVANARSLIAALPGSGPARGIWYYGGSFYGFRNNSGGTACIMHKATAAGWAAVTMSKKLDFTSGGVTEIVEGNTITGATSGAVAVVKRVVLTSGAWADGNAAGYFVFDSQTGNFQAENINVGATLNLATIAGAGSAVTLPAGGRYQFVNNNFYGSANLNRMYGCNGVGLAFEFDGTTICPITVLPAASSALDKPKRIAVHRESLVLGYAGGAVFLSVVGNPLSYDGDLFAVQLGTGDEISDFISTRGALTILGENSVQVLYGSDSTDYQLEVLTEEAGAIPWTAQAIGTPIYMDNRGIRSMAASQAFGNFNLGTLSELIGPLLQRYFGSNIYPVASVRSRTKNLYRVYFSDDTGLSVYLGKRRPEILPFDIGKAVECICSIEDSNRQERILFGSDDGFIYEMDRGTSFDGEPISYFLRLPFNHIGAPHILKRFHQAVIECEAAPNTTLNVTVDYDYADPDSLSSELITLVLNGGGGIWDQSRWEGFYWSVAYHGTGRAYLEGVGRNMSLLIAGETADEPPHLLQGLTLFYTLRGLQR